MFNVSTLFGIIVDCCVKRSKKGQFMAIRMSLIRGRASSPHGGRARFTRCVDKNRTGIANDRLRRTAALVLISTAKRGRYIFTRIKSTHTVQLLPIAFPSLPAYPSRLLYINVERAVSRHRCVEKESWCPDRKGARRMGETLSL
ncbi:unnamed protein product, partial [Ectocarpus sp. 12 AP-2014]